MLYLIMAIFDNLFKKVKSITGYDKFLEQRYESFIRVHHQSEFEKLVSPFRTNIPFHTVKKAGKDLEFLVEPVPGIDFERQNGLPEPGHLSTYDLFFYLNNGTNERFAKMPSDFSNETFPNSLRTTSQDYNRLRIYVNRNKPQNPIEGRNWLEQVEEKYADAFEKEFSRSTINFFKSFFRK